MSLALRMLAKYAAHRELVRRDFKRVAIAAARAPAPGAVSKARGLVSTPPSPSVPEAKQALLANGSGRNDGSRAGGANIRRPVNTNREINKFSQDFSEPL